MIRTSSERIQEELFFTETWDTWFALLFVVAVYGTTMPRLKISETFRMKVTDAYESGNGFEKIAKKNWTSITLLFERLSLSREDFKQPPTCPG